MNRHSHDLQELLVAAGLGSIADGRTIVTGLTDDSRRVAQGDLFIAVRGERSDGRQFYGAAVRAGAAALAGFGPRPDLPLVPFVPLTDDRVQTARIAAAFFGRPAERLRTVGVTGTNGKTTTVYLIESILNAAMLRAGVLGTIRYSTGARTVEAPLTTPGPIEIQRLLAEMAESGVKVLAMEVSSHALTQRRVDGMRFDSCVVTNVTQDHFDYHGDFRAYRDAKVRIVELVQEGGTVCVNADDSSAEEFALRTPPTARLLYYGIATPNVVDIRGEIRAMNATETTLRISTPAGAFDVRLPLIGRHNVENALAAVAASVGLGIDIAAIATGLRSLAIVPGRLERVPVSPEFEVMIDYAHTPDAITKILAAVRPLVSGRLRILLGCGGDRDRQKRPLMARAAETAADEVILTSDNPRTESPVAIIEEMRAGMRFPARAHVVVDRRAAIEFALDGQKACDCLIMAGKGHENYQITAAGKSPFSDRQTALDWASRRFDAVNQ